MSAIRSYFGSCLGSRRANAQCLFLSSNLPLPLLLQICVESLHIIYIVASAFLKLWRGGGCFGVALAFSLTRCSTAFFVGIDIVNFIIDYKKLHCSLFVVDTSCKGMSQTPWPG